MIWQPSNGAALKHSMPTYPQIQPLDVGITGPGDGANIDAEMKQIQIMRRQIAFPLLLLVSGCTTQAWYEGFKIGAENECYKQPPVAVADCLSRLNKKTHEEYEKERTSK